MSKLLLCEILTMFSVLGKDGDFVLKCFQCCEDTTLAMMHLLYCSFTEMKIVKPVVRTIIYKCGSTYTIIDEQTCKL